MNDIIYLEENILARLDKAASDFNQARLNQEFEKLATLHKRVRHLLRIEAMLTSADSQKGEVA